MTTRVSQTSEKLARQSSTPGLALISCVAVASVFMTVAVASAAQTYQETALYTFTGSGGDGASPVAGLVREKGNLYGTTTRGGVSTCGSFGDACGTVFKLTSKGKKNLYSFNGGSADGGIPNAGVIFDANGNLYGTTYDGGGKGTGCDSYFQYCGTVFELSPPTQKGDKWREKLLHSFAGGATDGGNPGRGDLIFDAKGNLYGTTTAGGSSNQGVVYKLDSTGKLTILYSFTGGADGGVPDGVLIFDANGNLYGSTAAGGDVNSANCTWDNLPGCGVVFKLDKNGNETVLFTFTGGADGSGADNGGLIFDANGNLYGTTTAGGAYGNGVVFKLNSRGKETVLHSFAGGATDGGYPSGALVLSKGNLYGATYNGGPSDGGVVFKLTRKENETILYSFTKGADGGDSFANVIFDATGNLYGTTYYAGDNNSCGGLGCGVVFKLAP